jgi:hypothetical protein
MYIEYASIHRVHCCTYHIFVWWYYNYKILKSMGYKILKRMRLPRATCLSWRGGVVARAWAWRSWPPTWEGGDREWWHGHGPKSIPTRVHSFWNERTMGQVSSSPVRHALTCTYWPSTDIGQKMKHLSCYDFWTVYPFSISSAPVCCTRWNEQN